MTTTIAFVSFERDLSIKQIYKFQLSHEGVSKVSERARDEASERSERSKVERCGASERSERCKRTNVASDQVALSKCDCHE